MDYIHGSYIVYKYGLNLSYYYHVYTEHVNIDKDQIITQWRVHRRTFSVVHSPRNSRTTTSMLKMGLWPPGHGPPSPAHLPPSLTPIYKSYHR